MKAIKLISLAAFAMIMAGCASNKTTEDLTKYANPFVGTAYTGHTFPGACVPFGFVQASPQSGNFDWAHCSGYNNDDPQIWGFTQNQLSGTGCADLGDILIFPFSDAAPADFKSDKGVESATPGYYSVELVQSNVLAEATASEHVALYRFNYKGAGRKLYVDLQSGYVNRKDKYNTHMLDFDMTIESATKVSGYARVTQWVERSYFFTMEFSEPVVDTTCLAKADPRMVGPQYVLTFADSQKPVMVKVAMSSVGVDGAKKNMAAEQPGWDFEGVKEAARKSWNDLFYSVEVKGTPDQMTNFYTSLYHLFIQPNNIADVDGRYMRADDQVAQSSNGKYYSTFSLWDTFRSSHPFYSILMPELEAKMVGNMIDHRKVQGYLPIWQLWGKENFCMIANHAVPVVVEAALKGLPGIDPEEAYEAVKTSLTVEHLNSDWGLLEKHGYLPYDVIVKESISRTLEYCVDDYCAAQLAKKLGKQEDYEFFMKRSENWKNVFDPELRLARPRAADGSWKTPFNPFKLAGDYTEGNSWQYTWHVQHDPQGLIDMMGGADAFVAKLDSLFVLNPGEELTGHVSDVTGLIGQYAHGNEPCHHVAYFYTLAGRPDRTAEVIRDIFDKFYQNRPDGLCGNDDCGQMSAWYMFSSMGFYPVNTVNGEYVLGAPQIPEVTLRLSNGNVFKVVAENLSEANKYVASVTFNGQALDKVITYDQIMGGGELHFVMTDKK